MIRAKFIIVYDYKDVQNSITRQKPFEIRFFVLFPCGSHKLKDCKSSVNGVQIVVYQIKLSERTFEQILQCGIVIRVTVRNLKVN